MEAEGIYVGYKYYETRYYDSIVNPDSGADSSAGATQSDAWDYNEEVTITVPTKYLASYDYTNAKTYILDDGDYIFTAAAGAHEAINNILAEQGYTEDDGMDADGTGDVQTWNLDELDNTTFAVSNDTEITNVADSADLNYWTEEDTVTYLTRQDWEGTWPVNYNEVEINIGDSPKSEEWIAELRGETYTIQDGDAAAEAVDNGVRFHTDYIQQDQMDNVEDEFWTDLTDQISIDEAVGGVIHGGSQSDMLTDVENPVVVQNEGVSGFTAIYTDEETGETYRFNVHSQTLMEHPLIRSWHMNGGAWKEIQVCGFSVIRYGEQDSPRDVRRTTDVTMNIQARENLKYQLYTFANSAVMNVSTERVQTWWDTAISTVTYASGVLAQMKLTGMAAAAVEIVSGILRIAATVLLTLCLVTLITARVEGLGFIYFSNADVLQEVQTPANMSSAAGTIANMICLGAATVFSMIAAFFNLRKKETQN